MRLLLSDGSTWTRPAGTLLLLPRCEQDILSALAVQAMVGSFISASFKQEIELISTLEMSPQSTSASWSGNNGLTDTATSRPEGEENDFFYY